MSTLYRVVVESVDRSTHSLKLAITATNHQGQELPFDPCFYLNVIADYFCGLQLGSVPGGYLDHGTATSDCSGEPWLWVYAMKFSHDKDAVMLAHERLNGPFEDLDTFTLKDSWLASLPPIDTWHHEAAPSWEKWRTDVMGAAMEWSDVEVLEEGRNEYDAVTGLVLFSLNVRDAKLLEHLVPQATLSVFYDDEGLIYNEALAG